MSTETNTVWKVLDQRNDVVGYVGSLDDIPQRGVKRVDGYVYSTVDIELEVPAGMGDNSSRWDCQLNRYVENGTAKTIKRTVTVLSPALILVSNRIHRIVQMDVLPDGWNDTLESIKARVLREYLDKEQSRYADGVKNAEAEMKRCKAKLAKLEKWRAAHKV